MMIKKLDQLLIANKEIHEPMKLAVVACHDAEVLKAVIEGQSIGIIEPILIGDKEKTITIAKDLNIEIDKDTIIDEADICSASKIGVKMVSDGKANFIMKGIVDTATLLKAVLNKDWGLRTNSLLSHVMVYEVETYHKLLYLTDGGMNLAPKIDDKVKLIENAELVGRALGNEKIKVACLAAKEKIDDKMPATLDADKLKKRYEEGKFNDGVIVDGPMALDLAISPKAATIKGYNSLVAGDADVLLVPNIEMGNGIGKSMTYFANGKSAGIIMGAKSPIVLVSRADDHETKLYSIALGSIIANYQNKNKN